MLRPAFVIGASVMIAVANSAHAADVNYGGGGVKDGPEALNAPSAIVE